MAYAMVFAFAPKLKIVFLLYIFLLYILLGLLWSTFSVYQTKLSANDSAKEVRYRTLNLNLRNAGIANSKEELDYLLNIRKLILFAVHELNEPLKYTNCTKWWANPLDLVSHEETFKSATHVVHSIKCYIQPGNLELVVTIRQHEPPIEVGDRELEIIGTFNISNFVGNQCGKEIMENKVAETCLCYNNKHFEEYIAITYELRKNWNYTDTELITWYPDKSYFVTDYMNFTDYDFVTSPGHTTQDMATLKYSTEYCGPDIKMLIMVSSAPSHFEYRRMIRRTYANSSNLDGKGIKVVFLMGVPVNETLNDEVKHEAILSKDIIQANFDDSYHNLTISHLSMYKWAHLTCIEGKASGVTVPQFILKADDDFLLNLDLALEVALKNSEHEFIGTLFCSGKAVRNVDYMTKYYTPRYMHISNSYAGYLSGVAYVLRADIIPRLLHMSATIPIIHMDDAYVTGLLVRPLLIYPKYSKLFTYGRIEPDSCESKKTVASCVLDRDDMMKQWNMLMKPMPSNCTFKDLKMEAEVTSDKDLQHCFFK